MDCVGSVSCDLSVDELVAAEILSVCLSGGVWGYCVGFLVECDLVAYWSGEYVWISECRVCLYGDV
jgi:hypothetical protein